MSPVTTQKVLEIAVDSTDLNGIPNRALKVGVKLRPDMLVELCVACLKNALVVYR